MTHKEAMLILRKVDAAFMDWKKAQARVSRSRKPDSLAAARVAAIMTEKVYRQLAKERDDLVAIWRARQTQRCG